MTMKSGANFKDQAAIKRLGKEGVKARDIADSLRLPLSCVESFLKEKSPAKKAAAEKAAAEKAAAEKAPAK